MCVCVSVCEGEPEFVSCFKQVKACAGSLRVYGEQGSYQCVGRGSAVHGEQVGGVVEADGDGQDGDVVAQHHGALGTGVGGVVDQVIHLQRTVLRHIQVPLEGER